MVLYPIYFDKTAPRPPRRVPLALALDNPTADDVAQAALKLRLQPVLEKGVAHPRRPWEKNGRVLIEIRGSKSVLMRQVAEIMSGKPA